MNAAAMRGMIGAMVLAAAGCATESTTYQPASEANVSPPAASYPIPAKDAKGTVYVISFGGEPMPTPAGTQGFYLHLRLAAENRTDASAWTIETPDQVMTLGSVSESPTYAQGSSGDAAITVTQGQHGYLDLFYPLPAQDSPQRALLSWKVHRGGELVTGTTPLELVPGGSPRHAEYEPTGVSVEVWPDWWWGVGFYPWIWGPGFWGPGRGYFPYWGHHPHWGPEHSRREGMPGGPGPGFRGGGRFGRGFHR